MTATSVNTHKYPLFRAQKNAFDLPKECTQAWFRALEYLWSPKLEVFAKEYNTQLAVRFLPILAHPATPKIWLKGVGHENIVTPTSMIKCILLNSKEYLDISDFWGVKRISLISSEIKCRKISDILLVLSPWLRKHGDTRVLRSCGHFDNYLYLPD